MKEARPRIHDRGDDPRRHVAAPGRDGFARLLRAEFTKFRTVRAWVIGLCAAAVVFVLLSFLSAFESRAPVPAVPVGPDGEAVADTYMFVHRTLAGDGALTSRVTSLSGTYSSLSPVSGSASRMSSKSHLGSQRPPGLAPWAKAGIILEPDTKQGTAYAAVMVTGSHGVEMQYNYSHDSQGLAGAAGPSSPRWLRLTRAGDVITGYDSAGGARWTEIGTVRLTGLPRTVQIGLFVTSPAYFGAGPTLGPPALPPPVSTASPLQVTSSAARGLQTRLPASTRTSRPLPPGNSHPPTHSPSAGQATSHRSWGTSSPPSGQAPASSTGQSPRSSF